MGFAAPSSFTMLMQRRVRDGRLAFSNKDDLKTALALYQNAFVRLFEQYHAFEPSGLHTVYAGHGWEEEEARSLAAALEYAAQRCKLLPTGRPLLLSLEGNHFGEVGKRLIRQAVQFGKIFADVRF